MKNHEGKNTRERSSSVGSNQTEKHPRSFARRALGNAMSIYREYVLREFYFSGIHTILCVISVILLCVVRNSSRRDSARVGIKFYLRGRKTALRLRNSRFYRNRYIRPSDCKLTILFSLVLIQCEIEDCDIGRRYSELPNPPPLTGNSICE